MKLNLTRVVISVAAAFALAACSDEEGGAALPAESQPNTASSQPPGTSSAPDGGTESRPTASLDPCSLLSADDLGEFGDYKEGTPDNGSGARGCRFMRVVEKASDDADAVGVLIRDSQGVDEVRDLGDGVQPGSVPGGRKAVMTSGNGGCLIALAVGENSRVDVGIVANTAERACQIADAMAKIVEPKLPEG
nr:DUF3558 family protein [Amycolatopsis marina]